MSDEAKGKPASDTPPGAGRVDEKMQPILEKVEERIQAIGKIPHASPTGEAPPAVEPIKPVEHGEMFSSQMAWAQQVHGYVNEYIRFADGKAAFLFAINTSAIGFLYSNSIFNYWTSTSICGWKLLNFLAFLSTFAFAFSAVCAFLVVKPRLNPRKERGLIFWETVAAWPEANQFVEKALSLSASGMISEVLNHVYQLSHVAKGKYEWLGRSIWACGIGTLLAAACFALVARG